MKDNELDRDIDRLLEPLRNVAPRNPRKAAAGRAEYITNAEKLFSGMPVSQTPIQRLNGWITGMIHLFKRKERFDMFSILTAVVLTLTVLFGGAGATVYAAQGSMPDEVLYPVKTFSEDLRLNLAAEPEAQVNLLLNYADRRVDEIANLLAEGEPVSQEVQERFQEQMANALKVAAGMDDESMVKYMALIQLRANNQLRIVTQIQLENPGTGAMTQQRVRSVIEEQLSVLEMGLQDPQGFANQFQHQFEYQQGLVTDTITGTLPVTGTFAHQNQFQNQFQHQQGISGTITGTVPITGTQYSPGPYFRPEDPGPGVGPGPGGDDGGTGSGSGTSQGDHDQDAYNQGDNDNSGGSDNGGGTNDGSTNGGTNGGSNGGSSGGSSGGGGGGGGG